MQWRDPTPYLNRTTSPPPPSGGFLRLKSTPEFGEKSYDRVFLLPGEVSGAHARESKPAWKFKNDFQKGDSVADYVEANQVELTNLTDDTWFIRSVAETILTAKIKEVGTPLKEWDVQINFGIKTGCNQAFIIDYAYLSYWRAKFMPNWNR